MVLLVPTKRSANTLSSMVFSSLIRITLFAWQSFWRNFWLSVVTVSIIVLTFISINSLVIINFIADAAVADVKDKVDVSLYFRPDITEAQVLEVQTYLSALTQVKDIVYVSQPEALNAFRQLHREDTTIIQSLESLDSNPLSATLQIHAKTIEDYPSIVDVINNSKYNDLILDKSFDDNQRYISGIKSTSDNVNRIVLIMSILFTAIAVLIVFNTIRVAIYTHQQEIHIMKLVGATNWFIRAPFLFEAIFYGVLACLVSIAGVYGLLNFIQPHIFRYFIDAPKFDVVGYFNTNFWKIFGVELLVIILLNITSSSIAIRRYLKV